MSRRKPKVPPKLSHQALLCDGYGRGLHDARVLLEGMGHIDAAEDLRETEVKAWEALEAELEKCR